MDKKHTIYADIDEDITELISKVKSAHQDVIALVLPKRSSVMQSVVNVRLLSRVAKQKKKNLVLITSDKTVISHAATAGLYVANNLTTKPYLPKAEAVSDQQNKVIEEPIMIGQQQPVQANKSKSLDELPAKTPDATTLTQTAMPAKKTKPKKKVSIPDFNKFRTLLIGGGVAIVGLVGFMIWAILFAGSATIMIKTDTTEKPVSLSAKLDTKIAEVDAENKILPAKKESAASPASEKTVTTGTKDVGAKATGTITLTNCSSGSATVPAGTGISSGSSTYITQKTVQLGDGNFTSSGACKATGDHVDTVTVAAQNNGDQYNSEARNYSVSGFSSVKAQGGSMTGGSSKQVKVVSQNDVDSLKAKIVDKQKTAKDELKNSLTKDGYTAIEDTFKTTESGVTISPAVGTESDDVTVSATYTTTMLGIKQEDVKKIIEKTYESDIKSASYTVSDYGMQAARYSPDKDSVNVAIETAIKIGPVYQDSEIKSLVMGRKQAEAEDQIKAKKGVVEATVKVTPFWKTKVPKKENKINITTENK